MHFANKFNIMVVRLMSKWDLRRLCRSISATALPNLTVPSAEETGFCSVVQLEEVGDTTVVVFRQGSLTAPTRELSIRNILVQMNFKAK